MPGMGAGHFTTRNETRRPEISHSLRTPDAAQGATARVRHQNAPWYGRIPVSLTAGMMTRIGKRRARDDRGPDSTS